MRQCFSQGDQKIMMLEAYFCFIVVADIIVSGINVNISYVCCFLFRSSHTMACSSAALRCVSNSVFTETATLCLH